MQEENALLQNRLDGLDAKYKERNKSALQFETMYKKLKQAQLAAGIELAVEHDADNILQGTQPAGTQARDSQYQVGGGTRMRRNGSNGSSGSGDRRRMTLDPNARYGSQAFPPPGSRTGLNTSRKKRTIYLYFEGELTYLQKAVFSAHPLRAGSVCRTYTIIRLSVSTTRAWLAALALALKLLDMGMRAVLGCMSGVLKLALA